MVVAERRVEMRTVKEMSVISGVSVRTLHYYDEIGLLKPAYISQKGYRYYDEQALKQLQKILFFRELKFPLKEIRHILENENLDEKEILAQQIKLLELERKHLNEIIAYAYQLQEGGEIAMDFSVFDKKELNQYAQEVKERWGDTEAYREYEAHTKKNKGESMEEKSRKLLPKTKPCVYARIAETLGTLNKKALCANTQRAEFIRGFIWQKQSIHMTVREKNGELASGMAHSPQTEESIALRSNPKNHQKTWKKR